MSSYGKGGYGPRDGGYAPRDAGRPAGGWGGPDRRGPPGGGYAPRDPHPYRRDDGYGKGRMDRSTGYGPRDGGKGYGGGYGPRDSGKGYGPRDGGKGGRGGYDDRRGAPGGKGDRKGDRDSFLEMIPALFGNSGRPLGISHVLDRIPHARLDPDFSRSDALWYTPEHCAAPILPLVTTTNVELKAAADEHVQVAEQPPATDLHVRVILPEMRPPTAHIFDRLCVLFQRDAKGNAAFYGGFHEAADGADIASPATWSATAARVLKAQGVELPEGTEFVPLERSHYVRETTKACVTLLARYPKGTGAEDEETFVVKAKVQKNLAGDAVVSTPHVADISRLIRQDLQEGRMPFAFCFGVYQLVEAIETYAAHVLSDRIVAYYTDSIKTKEAAKAKRALQDEHKKQKDEALVAAKEQWEEETAGSEDVERAEQLKAKQAEFDAAWATKLEEAQAVLPAAPHEGEERVVDATLQLLVACMSRGGPNFTRRNVHVGQIRRMFYAMNRYMTERQIDSITGSLIAPQERYWEYSAFTRVPKSQLLEQENYVPKKRAATPKSTPKAAPAPAPKEEAKDVAMEEEKKGEANGNEAAVAAADEPMAENTEEKAEEPKQAEAPKEAEAPVPTEEEGEAMEEEKEEAAEDAAPAPTADSEGEDKAESVRRLGRMSYGELQKECKTKGLKANGKKDDLITRLTDAL